MQKPSVGRVVHYVAHGTPIREDGTQMFPAACRAATVTEVDGDKVGLAVLNPTGMFFHSLAAGGGCDYHDAAEKPGEPDCPNAATHGNPFRYCPCGWVEAQLVGGTWHWPERIE